MRFALAGLLALTGCAGTCGQLGNNPIGSSRTLPIGDSSVGPRGGSTHAAVFPYEDTCQFVFDAADIDGDLTWNSAYTHGDKVSTWANKGPASPNSATTTSTGYEPAYCATCAGGSGALVFDGVADHMVLSSSTVTAAFVSDSADFEIFSVWTHVNSRDRFVVGNTNSGTTKGWSVHARDNYSRMFITSGAATNLNASASGSTHTFGDLLYTNWHADQVGSNEANHVQDYGAADTFTISGSLHTGAMDNSVYLGYRTTTTSGAIDGQLAFLAICDGEYTTDQRAEVEAWAQARFGAAGSVSPSRLVAALGDSNTATAPTRADTPWPQELMLDANASSLVVEVANNGTGGDTISDCQTEYTTEIDPRTEITDLVIMCGQNDIAAGTSAATVFTTWEAIVDDAILDGMAVYALEMLPRGGEVGWSGAKQTQLEALNTSINGKAGVTVVQIYDLFESDTNATYLEEDYQAGADQVHLNQAGNTLLADTVRASMGL